MDRKKPLIGLAVGVLLATGIFLTPLAGLGDSGRLCLALTLMTVAFWGFQIVQPGFSAGLYLALLVVFQVAPVPVIFAPWSGAPDASFTRPVQVRPLPITIRRSSSLPSTNRN